MEHILSNQEKPTPVLQIKNLEVTFPVFRGEVHALNQVSIVVEPGEIVGLVGESGSGKSVTAMLVMQLLGKTFYCQKQGEILFLGQDISHVSESAMRQLRGNEIAMIFQEPMNALNPTMKIGKQMIAVIRLHQACSKSEAKRKAIHLLQDMQIADTEEVLERYPFELSGGMRQRVLIAMAFSCNPKLIIADEPTTALDVTVQRQVLYLLQRKAQEQGTAILFITHDLAVVSQLCHRVYVMYAGHIIESGITSAVLTAPAHPYTHGLLAALPDGVDSGDPLLAIPGSVPDLTTQVHHCIFAERCHRVSHCCQSSPGLQTLPLYSDQESREVACWHALDIKKEKAE